MDSLTTIRDEIDRLDREMVALLDQRTVLAAKIAELKQEGGKKIVDPVREKQVKNTVKGYAVEPIVQDHIVDLYEQVMQIAKIKQQVVCSYSLPFNNIGIIGAGMMGGSIQKALTQADPKVTVTFIDKVDEISSKIDLLILAIPTSEVIKLTPLIQQQCKDIVVMDIASVKQDVVNQFIEYSNNRVEFVATHPMAGSEQSGIDHSSSGLFLGCRWIITPHQNNRPKTLCLVEELIQSLQADVVYLDAKSHDEKIGLVSHMIRVLSSSLYTFALEQDPMSIELAGPGFHSMTRLAKGNIELLDEMITWNKEQVAHHLDGLIGHLTNIRKKISDEQTSTNDVKERAS